MRTIIILLLIITSNLFSQDFSKKYEEVAKKIYQHAHKDSSSWERLSNMLDKFGHRLSGSANLEKTLDWILEEMKKDGLENVQADPVTVPHWVRNDAFCTMMSPWKMEIPVLALGGSIPTPKRGIESEVIVVRDLDHLRELGDSVENKIVLFNRPFTNYGETVQYRLYGADWASQQGAAASLIRSVTPYFDQNPHTGTMIYSDTITKIPHGAISLETADILQRLSDNGITPKLYFYMNCESLRPAQSRNVMCEITGSEKPNEIIAAGGHIDAWDVGQGAHDDGGPCVAAWEAVKLLKELDLRPKRTIRCVLWTNEENGLAGGKNYAEVRSKENHWLMFEVDSGVWPPQYLGYTGDEDLYEQFKSSEKLFREYWGEDFEIGPGGGGADISPMMKLGVPGMSLRGDSKGEYWKHHHSMTDTIDKIDKKDMNDFVAAIALALYIYADM